MVDLQLLLLLERLLVRPMRENGRNALTFALERVLSLPVHRTLNPPLSLLDSTRHMCVPFVSSPS